jgi:uncharacterized SAM-binding protein YcdF (DUF218 family)
VGAEREEVLRAGSTRRWGRWGIAAALVAIALGAAGLTTVRGVGHWLVVEDPLAQTRAIVVLTGHHPFRAMEAATLYREGWAGEVWLQRASAPAREAALRGLGFEVSGEEVPNRLVLERLGVPATSIRVLAGEARNTQEEVELVRRELARVGGDRVLLVTSKSHSRRLRAVWRAGGDSAGAIVRYAAADPFEPRTWWRSTADALAVFREVLGLLNLWAGFPIHAGRP